MAQGQLGRERRKLVLHMLDAVYVDTERDKALVAIQPNAPFRPIFQLATTKEGSGVILIKEPSGETIQMTEDSHSVLVVETGES